VGWKVGVGASIFNSDEHKKNSKKKPNKQTNKQNKKVIWHKFGMI
jgi:hypothetical protein